MKTARIVLAVFLSGDVMASPTKKSRLSRSRPDKTEVPPAEATAPIPEPAAVTTRKKPDSPPLDLTTRHGVSHWARIVGDYMLTLAKDVPRLDTLERMSARQRSNLAGDLIGNTVYVLRLYRWDKVLRWLRDNAPRGLVCDLEDKYNAVPVHDFQHVASVAMQMGAGETHVTASPENRKLPDTVSELVHLAETLRAFGEVLMEVSTATAKVPEAGGNGQEQPAGQPQAPPEPGDDDVTLPAIPPEWWDAPAADCPRTEIDREYDLVYYLCLMPKYHSLPAEKKENLVGALYRECDVVKEIIMTRLSKTMCLSGDARVGCLGRYQAFCRRLVSEAKKALDTGNLDVAVADQLMEEHIDLMEQMGLVLKLDHDILVKKAENAKARAPKSRPGGVFGFLLKAGETESRAAPPATTLLGAPTATGAGTDGNGQDTTTGGASPTGQPDLAGLRDAGNEADREKPNKTKPPKEPSKIAIQAYLLYTSMRISQKDVAKEFSRRYREPIKQWHVSRWLKDVREYYTAVGLPVDTPGQKRATVPVDPKRIDMGRRTDGRTSHPERPDNEE